MKPEDLSARTRCTQGPHASDAITPGEMVTISRGGTKPTKDNIQLPRVTMPRGSCAPCTESCLQHVLLCEEFKAHCYRHGGGGSAAVGGPYRALMQLPSSSSEPESLEVFTFPWA